MKLTDFATLPDQERHQESKLSWNLVFAMSLFAIVAATFVYDAYNEQSLNQKNALAVQK